ncbi:MAG: hypothetical protein HZA49_02920 [Planctomycetes bacterium]|nr:hypothetical protein [Planctomycetota bacterium]
MPKWIGESLHKPYGIKQKDLWWMQWICVKRWYKRVQEIQERHIKTDIGLADFDFIYAFFQNCYHLKDWLIASRPKLRKSIEDLFSTNDELQLCQDICNGTKHCELSRPRRDANFNIYREYDHFALPNESSDRYRIASDNKNKPTESVKTYDLFDLAHKCIETWKVFIINKKLDKQKPFGKK